MGYNPGTTGRGRHEHRSTAGERERIEALNDISIHILERPTRAELTELYASVEWAAYTSDPDGLEPGETTKYAGTSAITVEGIFKIRPIEGFDGRHLSIYHIDARSVK